ncbi:MAG: hypothetical protein RPR97_07185 [Colwellia sp.]
MMKRQKSTHSAQAERRATTDIWFYAVQTLSILAWIMFLFALVMSFYAAPDKNYGVLRFHDIEIRRFWLTPLTGYLYLVLWFSALASYFSLMIDKYRSRRRRDNPQFHLYFLLTVNLIWLVVILHHIAD